MISRLSVATVLAVLFVANVAPSAHGAISGTAAASAPASAATGSATTAEATDDVECGQRVIPLPNCGQRPQASGDRGGSAQLTLLGVLVGGLAFIGWRITASVRRHAGRDLTSSTAATSGSPVPPPGH